MKRLALFSTITILLGGVSAWGADQFEAGYSKLWIDTQNPGNQAWYSLHHQASRAWELGARADYVDRFGRTEGQLTPSATYHWGGVHSLNLELGVAPLAQVLPSFTGSLEYSRPVFSAAAISTGIHVQNYAQTQVAGASIGSEYYLKNGLAFVTRASLNHETFTASGTSDLQPAATLRTIYYLTDDDRIWAYGGLGSEGFMPGFSQEPGSIATRTWGVGGRKGFKSWGLESNLDWQNRDGAIAKLVTLSMALQYQF